MIIIPMFIALFVLILLLPYAWGYETNFLGRRSGWWRSVLYLYRYGPGYEHLNFIGLRQLQTWLLLVVAQLQPELVAWFVAALRQALGW